MRRYALWLMVVLMVSGCAPAGPATTAAEQAGVEEAAPSWPEPPAQARIRFVRLIAGSQDIGVRRSLIEKIGDILFGTGHQWMIRPAAAVSQGDLLAVADPGAQAVFLFNLAEHRLKKIRAAGREEFKSPVGVVFGGDRLYVSDSVASEVFVFTREGQYLSTMGKGMFGRPTGLGWDAASRVLYVVDTARHRITALSETGAVVRAWGERGTGPGQFNYPTQIAVDAKGNLYVTDTLNFRVQIFDREGKWLSAFGRHGDSSGEFAMPKGIGVDGSGHIYVADALFDAVQIFNREGRLLLAFGRQGVGKGEFWLPSGLTVGSDDRIFVADSFNQRIQIFRYVGGDDG